MKKRQNIRKFILLISFILYPITFFVMSPDLLLFGASERIMAGDVIFFGLLFILSFIVGRLFCGWICPAGALQEFCFDINKKPANNKFNWIKMLQFIPWIMFFVFLVIYFGGFKKVDFFYKRAFGVSMIGLGEWVMYFGTVAIIFFMAVLTGKRGLCHYICWVSPFMIIGGKIRDLLRIPSLRLITKPDLCNSCGLCSRVCPMSLPVDELVKNGEIGHSECILCATCIDSCPKGVIKFAFTYKQGQNLKCEKDNCVMRHASSVVRLASKKTTKISVFIRANPWLYIRIWDLGKTTTKSCVNLCNLWLNSILTFIPFFITIKT